MAATPTLHERTTDDEPETSNAPTFGVDADGGVHRWDAARGAVVITDADGRVTKTEYDVTRDEIAGDGRTWYNFVADEIGWIDFWFDDSSLPIGRVTAALDEVRE